MWRDQELSALLDQARRNLDTLELLAQRAQERPEDLADLDRLRDRIAALKASYTLETDAPEILARCRQDQVDAALLVPT